MQEKNQRCTRCGCVLRSGQHGNLCDPCQDNQRGQAPYSNRERCYDDQYYDLEQIRQLLGLESYEQARRKAQAREIPGKVPGVRRHLFDKSVVDAWLRGKFTHGYGVEKLSSSTVDTLQKLAELVTILERRLPIAKVVANFEERLPIKEVAARVTQFVQEAPPPDQVLREVVRTFVSR